MSLQKNIPDLPPLIALPGPIDAVKYRLLQARPDPRNLKPTSFNPPPRKKFVESGKGVSATGARFSGIRIIGLTRAAGMLDLSGEVGRHRMERLPFPAVGLGVAPILRDAVMTTNDPLPLPTIAELWAMDTGIPSASYAKAELIRAYWEGGFPDGTVFVDSPRFLDIVLPPDHDQNVSDGRPLEEVTRSYVAEMLADLGSAGSPQAIMSVRDGQADFAIMGGYPLDAYSPKQRALLDILRVSPSALAAWCDRTGRRRPSFLSELGYAPPQPKTSYMTGKPGRPSSSKLLLEELDRRGELGLVEDTLAKEAQALKAWADTAHPDAPPTTIKTISATIRAPYRILKNAGSTRQSAQK